MKNKYFFTPTTQSLVNAMDRLRNWEGVEGNYPMQLGNQKIMRVMDLTKHVMIDRIVSDKDNNGNNDEDHPRFFPKVEGSSQHIWFELENKVTITLRNSGTEPKLKYYIEGQGDYQNV